MIQASKALWLRPVELGVTLASLWKCSGEFGFVTMLRSWAKSAQNPSVSDPPFPFEPRANVDRASENWTPLACNPESSQAPHKSRSRLWEALRSFRSCYESPFPEEREIREQQGTPLAEAPNSPSPLARKLSPRTAVDLRPPHPAHHLGGGYLL